MPISRRKNILHNLLQARLPKGPFGRPALPPTCKGAFSVGRVLGKFSANLLLVLVIFFGCSPPAVIRTRKALEEDNLDVAQKQVEEGLSKQPANKELLKLAIQIHLLRGDLSKAVQVYQKEKDDALLRHLALSVMRWGLRHRNPAIRLAALQGARKTDAAPLEKNVAQRLQDPDEVVRTWAAVALSATPSGADTLGEQLRSRNDNARAVAVENLARIAKQAAIKTLTRFLTDPSSKVRTALARGLMLTKDPAAMALLAKLAVDKDRGVRTIAIAAIGQLAQKSGATIVKKALSDPYPGVRRAAIIALVDLGHQEAQKLLAKIAQSDDLPCALKAGARLWRLGEVQPVLNTIAKALVDRSWTVRSAACNTAGSIRDKVALKLVNRALRDPEPAVRMAAARAVLSHNQRSHAIRTATSLKNLSCKAENQTMEQLCLQSAELLARAGEADGVKMLKDLTKRGKSPEIRVAALEAAMTSKVPIAFAASMIPDQSPRVSIAAAIQIYYRLK